VVTTIVDGGIKVHNEPKKYLPYEVLDLPSTIQLDYLKGTKSETTHAGVKEIVVHVKISDLNKIRLPMDANPRKPEHISSLVKTIQESAQEEPNIFVFKNNGIDIFCKSIQPCQDQRAEENEDIETLQIEFGDKETKDGICNGGLTYYSLQPLSDLPDDACVKVRFYIFERASLELKSMIAKAKNQNRAVSSSDDANFMGYYDRIKEQLGPDLVNLVKWETGDVEVGCNEPITAPMLIRFLSALKIENSWHWALNTTAHPITSHESRNFLLLESGRALGDFVKTMRGGSSNE